MSRGGSGLLVAVIVLASLGVFNAEMPTAPDPGVDPPAWHALKDMPFSMPGYFTENAGQVDDQLYYYSSSAHFHVGFGRSAVVMALAEGVPADPRTLSAGEGESPKMTVAVVRMSFAGANSVVPLGVGELSFRSNF